MNRGRLDSDKAARLLEAAGSLARQRGLRGVTVAEIAERAHVGKGTVYLYWDTKEDLFYELFARDFIAVARDYADQLGAHPDLVRPHRLCPLMARTTLARPFVRAARAHDGHVLGLLADHPATQHLLDIMGPEAMLAAILPAWRSHGMARSDQDPERQMYALRSVMLGFFELVSSRTAPPPLDLAYSVLADTVRAVVETPQEPSDEDLVSVARTAIEILDNAQKQVLRLLADTDD
ncbi:TetR/AcrR family transcriptional regulator [Streptomyces sp. NPDC051644]|uniref:TetR/AcrR family transcriptional regulator n=1 Tax=Streptomyces sp. NPDC051644 TaxID=3365666 RepID=UPI00378B0E06